MPTATLPAGTVHYETSGPTTGRPVVFIHGYMMDRALWRPLCARLAARGLRCIAATWPLGAHPEPMRAGADPTLPGIASTVADLLVALDLDDVVLVGNDTGGVVAQLVAVHHPERLGALVLTSCDAFENFPPPILKPFIRATATRPGFRLALQTLRLPAARRQAFGGLAHSDLDDLAAAWVKPALSDPAIAEDLRLLTASLRQRTTLDVAARLPEFTGPALVAWSADDRFFPVEHAHRLASTLPHADLAILDRARTFSMLDQPERLAELVAATASSNTSAS